MTGTSDGLERTSGDLGPWLGFWAQFVVLGVLVGFGAAVAGQGSGLGDYQAGLLLCIAAIALGFFRLKQRLDGDQGSWADFMLVDTMANLAIVVPLFVVVGLIGLFVAAAWEYGSMHDCGIGLFITSGLIVFLSMKRVFDRLDRHS